MYSRYCTQYFFFQVSPIAQGMIRIRTYERSFVLRYESNYFPCTDEWMQCRSFNWFGTWWVSSVVLVADAIPHYSTYSFGIYRLAPLPSFFPFKACSRQGKWLLRDNLWTRLHSRIPPTFKADGKREKSHVRVFWCKVWSLGRMMRVMPVSWTKTPWDNISLFLLFFFRVSGMQGHFTNTRWGTGTALWRG